MKKFFIFLIALLLFTACETATNKIVKDIETEAETPVEVTETTTEEKPEVIPVSAIVRNVLWEKVETVSLITRAADGKTKEELDAEIEEYNKNNPDDPRYLDLEDTPIEKAPDAIITILYADTNEVYFTEIVKRKDVGYERDWQRRWIPVTAATLKRPLALYIDSEIPDVIIIPAPPPPPDLRTPYEKYSFYVLDIDGNVIWFEHVTESYNYPADPKVTEADCQFRINQLIMGWKSNFPEGESIVYGEIYVKP